MSRLLWVAALIGAVCAVTPGASSAAPPILGDVNFDQSTKVLTVTWSLPPGVESSVLEANTNPALDSQGYFLFGPNDGYYGPDTIFEIPNSAATTWVHSYPDLPAGHYYVHVGGFDSTCTSCPVREWTSLGTFDVSPPPPPPPPPPKLRKVFAPDCSGRKHFKPRSIIVACGDGNPQLHNLLWSKWSGTLGTGVGVYYWNDCVPACYRGHFHSRPGAQVRLYRVTKCRSKGYYEFTRMRVTPPPSLRRFRPFTQRLSCTFR